MILARVRQPFGRFISSQTASGKVLLAATCVALVWSNVGSSYTAFWQLPIGPLSLAHWVSDGLMALFFLSVGLEIKYELIEGKLSTRQKATLPFAAALGGMLVPALIYVVFNPTGLPSQGWGIPMATDIAFSLGIITVIGWRLPAGIRAFVVALAIGDDLGAVLVIALFYTASVNVTALLIALGLTGCLIAMNIAGVQKIKYYLMIGLVLWIAMMNSGVHATVAGVILGLTVPHRGKRKSSPLKSLERVLQTPVNFFIVPLFALASAGVVVEITQLASTISSPVFLGIGLGLLIGKPVGILILSFIAIKLKQAALPDNVDWKHMVTAAIVCGVGFTMSLFIGELALEATPELFTTAKLGILLGSLAAGLLGLVVVRLIGGIQPVHQVDFVDNPG